MGGGAKSQSLTVELASNLGYIEPSKMDTHGTTSRSVYRQLLTVNNSSAVSVVEIGGSMEPGRMFEPGLYWNIYIACKGKKSELFRIGFEFVTGKNVPKYLKEKKFEPPEDFKQIISSFRCRSDR